LEAAGSWEQDWLMQFHPKQCNILSITQKKKPILFSYKLHNHILEKVESSKYLGVILQNDLKWDKHINSITNKANQSLGFLRRNLKINSSKVKEHAYKAIVRPKLNIRQPSGTHIQKAKQIKLKRFKEEQQDSLPIDIIIQAQHPK